MIGNVLRFRVKRTLVGIAALSLLVPIASHADVTPGRWIFDGFSRSTRDGRGSTCVGSGGDTHAFEAPTCNSAASEAKATVEPTAKARKAAQDAAAAKRAAAAAEAKEFLPGGQKDFRVRRSDGIKIVDGFGRDCVKNGSIISSTTGNCADPTPQSARGVESIITSRSAADKEARAAQAAAAAAATALPLTPGGALVEGQNGAYVYRPAGSNVRDGYGRSCVKDGLWHPAFATEECDPDLYNQWAAKSAQPEPDLLKRIEMPPPEVQRAVETSAAPAPAVESAPAPASAAPAPVVDTAPAVFPITTYSIDDADDATLPTVAALAAAETDDSDEDEDVIADSDEAIDDGDDAPPVFAAETDDDITDSEAMVAADDDEDEDALPEDPEEEDDDTMPFLAGDMRDEDDSVLALDDDESLDGEDDALLDEDDAPAAAFMTAGGDEDEDEDDIVAADDVEDDTETAYLGDGDAAEADDAPMLAMVAEDDDDDDAVFATEDEDDDTETAYLGDGDVAEADEAPIAAMVADDDDDAVFATDDDDDAPPVFADEPAAPEPTPAMVVAETAPEVTSAPVAVQPDQKQVEFPVTRYEFDGAAEVPPEPAAPEAVVAPVVNAECPPTTIQMEEGRFAFDRFNLRPEVISKLDAIADLLKTAKCDAILITGHTDRIGTSKYNQRLSERRAAAAKSYLVERKGIDPSLISVVGVGKNEPVTTVADCKGKRKKALIACYAPDRRVVITATVRKPAN